MSDPNDAKHSRNEASKPTSSSIKNKLVTAESVLQEVNFKTVGARPKSELRTSLKAKMGAPQNKRFDSQVNQYMTIRKSHLRNKSAAIAGFSKGDFKTIQATTAADAGLMGVAININQQRKKFQNIIKKEESNDNDLT